MWEDGIIQVGFTGKILDSFYQITQISYLACYQIPNWQFTQVLPKPWYAQDLCPLPTLLNLRGTEGYSYRWVLGI